MKPLNPAIRLNPRLIALPLAALAVVLSGMSSLPAATVLFSQNFQAEYAAGRTSLTASGWSNVTNDWINSYNTTSYAVATATASGGGTYGSLSGPSHAVSGMNFSTSGAGYQISSTFATNANGITTANRQLVGACLTTSDPNGIYAYLGDNGSYISICIGNPAGTATSYAPVSLSTPVTANTFYTLTLTLTSTTATATLYDISNSVIGTTSFTLTSTLTGTPYGAVRLGQRSGNTSSLDYFSSVSVTAIPEPSTAFLGLSALCLATLVYRRRHS